MTNRLWSHAAPQHQAVGAPADLVFVGAHGGAPLRFSQRELKMPSSVGRMCPGISGLRPPTGICDDAPLLEARKQRYTGHDGQLLSSLRDWPQGFIALTTPLRA